MAILNFSMGVENTPKQEHDEQPCLNPIRQLFIDSMEEVNPFVSARFRISLFH